MWRARGVLGAVMVSEARVDGEGDGWMLAGGLDLNIDELTRLAWPRRLKASVLLGAVAEG